MLLRVHALVFSICGCVFVLRLVASTFILIFEVVKFLSES